MPPVSSPSDCAPRRHFPKWTRPHVLLLSLATVAGAGSVAAEPSLAVLVDGEALSSGATAIHGGYRYESLGELGLAVSRDVLPEGGDAQAVSLPPALGGGYLFSVAVPAAGGARTALYRAETFTGELQPLALVPVSNVDVFPQRSRVVLRSASDVLEFDPFELRLRSVNFGPRAVDPSRVQLMGPSSIAIEVPLVGVLFSRDEGVSYRLLPDVMAFGPSGSGTVETPVGRRILEETGELRMLRSSPSLRSSPPVERDERRRWLSSLVESGTRRGETLVALTPHGRIEATRTPHLELRIDPTERRGGCRGFDRLDAAARARFLCASEDAWTLVEEGGREVLTLAGRRRLVAIGRGAFLVSGGCSKAPGGLCAVVEDRGGVARSIDLPAPARGERLGIVDGEVWSVHSARGKIRAERRTGSREWFEVDWPREKELAEWFETFVALPGWSGESGRSLGLVLTRGDEFVGVRLRFEDKALETGPVKRGLQRAAFYGDSVFLWGASGYVQRSLDGGITYHDLRLPYSSGDGDPSTPRDSREPSMFGCSGAGCVFGRAFLLWPRDAVAGDRVSIPERVLSLPPSGRARWSFQCDLVEGPRASPKDAEFWGTSLPGVSPAFGRVSALSVDELGMLAVDGPASLSYRGLDLVRLFYREPFGAEVRLVGPTKGLFVDAADAEQALGLLDRSAGNAYLVTSADGRSGLFSSQVRDRVHAFAFDGSGELTPLYGLSRGAAGGRFSVARSGRTLAVGEHTGSEFLLSEVVQQRLEPIARFPMFGGRYRRTEVVADERGRLALSLQTEAGVLVHPVLADRTLGEPTLVPLTDKLPPCAVDAVGYVVSLELSVAPDLSSDEGPLLLLRPSVRLRVGPTEACLDSLAARARGGFSAPSKRSVSAGTIPLVVSDFADERVSRLLCR